MKGDIKKETFLLDQIVYRKANDKLIKCIIRWKELVDENSETYSYRVMDLNDNTFHDVNEDEIENIK